MSVANLIQNTKRSFGFLVFDMIADLVLISWQYLGMCPHVGNGHYVRSLFKLNLWASITEVLLFGNFDWVKNTFFLNPLILGVAAASTPRMGFFRTFFLSTGINWVTYWVKQYGCYYFRDFLCATNNSR